MPNADKPLAESPSQTAGPYVHIGCMPNFGGIAGIYPQDPGCRLVNDATRGERITIRGGIYDGGDEAVRDAVIEIWQADSEGRYPSPADRRGGADPGFSGWGRCATDFDSGEFVFDTIRPGRVPFAAGCDQAPHILLWIVARGINIGLQTRLYFADETEANAADPVLASIEPQSRVATLMARQDGDAGAYRFDIRLQGADETVFFDM